MGWDCHVCPDLKLSNRPVRTRMPGGVAGVAAMIAAPYADIVSRFLLGAPKRLVSSCRLEC